MTSYATLKITNHSTRYNDIGEATCFERFGSIIFKNRCLLYLKRYEVNSSIVEEMFTSPQNKLLYRPKKEKRKYNNFTVIVVW